MNWKERKLGEFFRIRHGYAFQSSYFADEGEYVLLTPGNFEEEGGFRLKKGKEKYYSGELPTGYVLKEGDLLIAMTEQAEGLLGSSALIPENNRYLHNQRLGLVSKLDEERLDRRFLYYLFNSRDVRKQIKVGADGTKVKHTSPDRIYKVSFKCPPIEEQREIAEILGMCDQTIDPTANLIKAKRQFKRGLMQQLLRGNKRFQEFVKSDGTRLTKFGRVPNDWTYVHVGDIAREVSEKNAGGKHLTVLSCTKRQGLVDSLSYFGKRIFSANVSAYKVVRRGQFAYATNHIEEGSIGYQYLYDEALISPMYTVFETTERVDDAFLYALLKTELYRHIFEVNTSASVDRRGSLRWKEFAKIKVALPSIEEQRHIAAVLNTCDKEIDLLRKQLDALKHQKRGLMQELLTGRKPPLLIDNEEQLVGT